jgi:hypothetical protein
MTLSILDLVATLSINDSLQNGTQNEDRVSISLVSISLVSISSVSISLVSLSLVLISQV